MAELNLRLRWNSQNRSGLTVFFFGILFYKVYIKLITFQSLPGFNALFLDNGADWEAHPISKTSTTPFWYEYDVWEASFGLVTWFLAWWSKLSKHLADVLNRKVQQRNWKTKHLNSRKKVITKEKHPSVTEKWKYCNQMFHSCVVLSQVLCLRSFFTFNYIFLILWSWEILSNYYDINVPP